MFETSIFHSEEAKIRNRIDWNKGSHWFDKEAI